MGLVSSWSLVFLSFSLLSSMIPKSTSTPNYLYNFCSNTTTFTPNSQYHTNLNTLFHSLSTNATSNPTGFFTTTIGTTTTNTVYGLFICRGDQNTTSCHDCVATATTTDLPKTYCPNTKTAVIWYEECMVRYSNESFFGKMDQSPKVFFGGDNNVTRNMQTRFSDTLGKMMDEIAIEAATGDRSSGKKFATRVANVTSTEGDDETTMFLYGLGQCTPDLTANECNLCLRIAIGSLKIMTSGSVLQPSCIVEYDTSPFFDVPATNNSTQASPPGISPSERRKVPVHVIIAIVVPIATISAALLAIGMCFIHKKAKKDYTITSERGEEFTTIESLQYDLHTLKYATNNFSDDNRLGEGGFGVVYKGTLKNGREIAVKRLSISSNQGVLEFQNEVLLVAKLQHRNLVRLLGFCLEGEEKLLVYEYVPLKSLDHFLFDSEQQRRLDWNMRYKIIVGIARGMLYLHQDARLRIIHRDLKASNVLLDGDMNPKIADFGMARIFGMDQTEGNTSRVVGTYGYMAPEYAMHGQFSNKSDVYSYGVLVLEIISGKRTSTFYGSGHAKDLLSYAWKQWKDEMPLEFVDPTIRDSCSSDEVMRCIQLGLLCVQHSKDRRPTMATVVHKLDSYSTSIPAPEQPGFFIKSAIELDYSIDTRSNQSTSQSMSWTTNDVTITEFEPR